MKKLLLLLAMTVMVIGLVAGCGKSADNGGDKKSGTIGFFFSPRRYQRFYHSLLQDR